MWIENISEYDTCHCVLHQHSGQSHCCLLAGSLPQPLLLDLDFVTVLSARKSGVVQLKQKSCHVSSNFTFYWLHGPEYFPGPARALLPCPCWFTLPQLQWPRCSFSTSRHAGKPRIFAHFPPHACDTLLYLSSGLCLSSYLQVPAQALREVFLNHPCSLIFLQSTYHLLMYSLVYSFVFILPVSID